MKGCSVLHFAPEKKLSEVIAQHNPGTYVKADLFPSDKSIQRVDLLDIPYGANYFDFVICNHVLEHVSDYRLALSEIRRVLKTNGYAILQTPYSRKLTRTFHDPGLADDFSRLIAYGQEDHLRLFGNNIFDEISSCGFISMVARHEDILGELDHVKYGVNPNEPLFLFQCDGR
jgi:SAM-dependent methyltransferase